MCIIFIYNGCKDESCEYSLILVTNRDESFGRPSKSADFWEEDPNVIGGKELYIFFQVSSATKWNLDFEFELFTPLLNTVTNQIKLN